MKKVKFLLAALVAVVGVSVVAAPVMATTNDDVLQTLEGLVTKETALSSELSSSNPETYANAVDSMVQNIKNAESDLDAAASSAGSDFAPYINNLKDSLDAMATKASALAAAARSGDATKRYAAQTAYLAAQQDYQTAVTSYANYLSDHPEQTGDGLLTLYLAMFIAACVLAVASIVFVLMIGRKLKSAELKGQASGLIFASLLMVAGTAVTYFSYRTVVVNGGTYTFSFWWIIGLIAFIAGAINYTKGYMKAKKEGTLGKADIKIPKVKGASRTKKTTSAPTDKK